MDGFDETRPARVIAEGFAQLIDRQREHPIADVGIGPRRIEELALGYDLMRLLHQPTQDEEGLRREVDAPIAPPDALVRLVHARRTHHRRHLRMR